MSRFTYFTNGELNRMESAFLREYVTDLAGEVGAEKRYREKIKEEQSKTGLLDFGEQEKYKALKDQLERLAMNANYGMVTRSCDDDEKLVVLCMINKQLKDMSETLARVDDKI